MLLLFFFLLPFLPLCPAGGRVDVARPNFDGEVVSRAASAGRFRGSTKKPNRRLNVNGAGIDLKQQLTVKAVKELAS